MASFKVILSLAALCLIQAAPALHKSKISAFTDTYTVSGTVEQGLLDRFTVQIDDPRVDRLSLFLNAYEGDPDLRVMTVVGDSEQTWSSGSFGSDNLRISADDWRFNGEGMQRTFYVGVYGFSSTPSEYSLVIALHRGPEPVIEEEPVEEEPEPAEPEPAEPEPAEPEPAEPEPATPVEPEPATPVEAEPATPVEAEPATPVEAEPATPSNSTEPVSAAFTVRKLKLVKVFQGKTVPFEVTSKDSNFWAYALGLGAVAGVGFWVWRSRKSQSKLEGDLSYKLISN